MTVNIATAAATKMIIGSNKKMHRCCQMGVDDNISRVRDWRDDGNNLAWMFSQQWKKCEAFI